jgi:hypothetical protein
MSPVVGLIVPMNATSAMKTKCWEAGKAIPVAIISPIASVSTAEPSSAAAATIPI